MDVIKSDMNDSQTGFTLIELMMVLMISAILAMLAGPSFNEIIRNNRLATMANDFVSTLNFARSEAVKRGAGIIVCSSDDQATCTNTDWKDGWIVQLASTGELIRVHAGLDGSDTTFSNVEGNTSIQYNSRGMLNGNAATTFHLCVYAGKPGRQISITATGRPRSSEYNGC